MLTWAFHTKQFHKHCFPLVVMLMLLWSVFLAANISPRLLDPSELFLSISQTALARLDCYDSLLQAHVEFSCSSCSRCKNCKTCEILPMWYRLKQNCFGTALVYCVCLAWALLAHRRHQNCCTVMGRIVVQAYTSLRKEYAAC